MYLGVGIEKEFQERLKRLQKRVDAYERGDKNMSKNSEEEKQERIDDGKKALAEARNFKKYINIFLHGRRKQFIIQFLQQIIADLKETHDQYYRPGKEDADND
jgi:hypothetical protein